MSVLLEVARRVREALLDRLAGVRHRLRPRTRRTAASQPWLLMIDEMIPDPQYGAGYPRARETLEAIVANGWRVTFYPLIASRAEVERMRDCALAGVDFRFSNGRRALRRLLLTHGDRFDAVMVSRPPTIQLFKDVVRSLPGVAFAAYRIYDAEAVFAPREALRRSLFGYASQPREHEDALDAELALLQDADAITAVSFADAQLFRARTPAEVFVLGHRMTARPTPANLDARHDLLFVGRLEGRRDESPNVDSLVWFVRDVMPALDAILGTGYRLQVAGVVNSDEIRALASERVVLHHVVDDLTALYANCRVFIAPTRFAAGIPRKVHDAFGAGLPCVVTPLLAAQIGMEDGGGVLVAGDPQRFAARCADLYTDAQLWTTTREAALERLERDFSDKAFDDALRRLLQIARSNASARRPHEH